jgi:hypothetical protein
MTRLKHVLATSLFALLAVLTTQANATFIGHFGSPDFQWIHPSGGATPNHIWVAGDEWKQTFTGTGQASANAMVLDLFINDNILTGPSLILDVLLNGIDVGDITIAPGVSGAQFYGFTFASILGDTYTVEMVVRDTIPGGDGSVSMAADNERSRVFLTTVPEPGTLALLVLALGGIVAAHRRA